MNRIRRFFRNNSIQTKFAVVMAMMLIIILVVNLFIYIQTNVMVERIDSVFSSNVTIGELTETLGRVEDTVYEYLNTKGSGALENYYRFSQDYRNLIEELNSQNVEDRVLMLEKSIREMSESYLATADETVQAKRGRNVEKYKNSYAQEAELFRYINNYIYELNSRQFERNSENYRFLLSSLGILEIMALTLIVVVFLLSGFIGMVLVRRMVHPLVELSETAREVAEGNFSVKVPQVDSEDEIGIVTKTFDQMLSSIRAYIVRIRSSLETEARMKERELSMEAHLKEAQLKFLQAQINPHFLFNSLNAGSQLATLEDADATALFLQRMADFFRYNVQKTGGESSLQQEIGLVDNYIYILNVRFAGDITYRKEVPGDVGDPDMPGMILQPLVENAVTHGIRDRMDRGIIRLQVEKEEDGLQIIVSDNGVGMTREQIRRIYEGTADRSGEDGSTGIGLGNVINRLSLYYNREDLLTIHSEGEGTEVILFLPKMEKG